MISPQINQIVKCVFHNGMLIEGTVLEWNETQALIRALDSGELMIIPNLKDIILIKMGAKPTTIQSVAPPQLIADKIQQTLQESKPDLQNKNIGELKQMLFQQEKKMIQERSKELHLTQNPMVRYEYPRFFHKK